MTIPLITADDGNPIFVQSQVTAYKTYYLAGVLTSPTRVDLRVRAGTAAAYTPYTSIAPTSAGQFSQSFTVDQSGVWYGEWIAYNSNGTVNRTDAFSFVVDPNPV